MRDEIKLIRGLWPLLRTYPWGIPAIVGLGVLASLAEGIGISLFIPFLQSIGQETMATDTGNWLVDSLNGLFGRIPPEHRLEFIAGGIFGSVLVKTGLAYSNHLLFTWLDTNIGHRLRSQIFDQLMSVSYRFLERRSAGKLLNTLSTESWRTSEALSVLVSLIIALCTLSVYTALLLLISWKLTLVVLVAMAGISMLARRITRRARRLGKRVTRANEALASRMLEGVYGARVIRAFGQETREQARFDRTSERVSRTLLHLGAIRGAVRPVYQILSTALLAAILLLSLQHPSNLPALLVFIFVLYRLQPKVNAVDDARVGLASLAAAVQEVIGLLDRAGKPYLDPGTQPFGGLRHGIRFERVTFRYDPADAPALDDVSVDLPAGRMTALVGPSGAGKSTMVKLLLRLYDPDAGTIHVDDQPLPDVKLQAWRQRLALVSQDIYLFNTTIRNNIAYGRPRASDEAVVEAAKQADAHAFIEALPRGYETRVGERGVRLSGGQKQRIALARAIVRDPDVLLLDEATNALDSISEQLIQEAIDLLGRDRTIVVIAHRLATVRRADHIVVLDDGRVCEQGTFSELLAHDGLFARLYHLQHQRVEIDGA